MRVLDALYSLPMIEPLLRLWQNLTNEHKKRIIYLILLMLIGAFADLLSLTSFVPFLGLISDPNRYISLFHRYFGTIIVIDPLSSIYIAAVIFVLATVASGLLRIFLVRISGNLAASIGSNLGARAYSNILNQSYEYHRASNSSDALSVIVVQIEYLVRVVYFAIQLFSSSILSGLLLITLLVWNWQVSMLSAMVLFASFWLIANYYKRNLRANSRIIDLASRAQVKSLQEGFGAIRHIILDDTTQIYLDNFTKHDSAVRKAQAENIFVANFPRYALETIALLLLICITIFLVSIGKVQNLVVILGGFALGLQRLLMSIQNGYNCWAGIASQMSSVDAVNTLLNLSNTLKTTYSETKSISFDSSLRLSQVGYCYPNESQFIFEDLNLEIVKGSKIGIIGPTGSGKSTLTDIILGLVSPTTGSLIVDGDNICNPRNADNPNIVVSINSWRKLVSCVPQDVYLSDSSFAENIALGVPLKYIDKERLLESAKVAMIHEFILSSSDGYSTRVGERGYQLSGGQRQRIGIARAIYKGAKLIVFDEATSALDSETESQVVDSLSKLSSEITIVIVAHRFASIQKCDCVYRLDSGKLSKIEISEVCNY